MSYGSTLYGGVSDGGGASAALSDSIAFSDSVTTTAARHTALADALTLADAVSTGGEHSAAVTDTLAFADSVATTATRHAGAADSLALTDAVAVGPRSYTAAVGDSINLSDTVASTSTLYARVGSIFLSPYGCFNGQVPDGDSHYDTLKTTIGDPFVIQWKSSPRQLESGQFPGALVPQVRVGRDTDLVFDESQAANPQETSKAEDNATAVIAQAQGLGGASSGNLTAEAFNFGAIEAHPLVLSEAEQLPATSELSMLVLQLETLLGLRSNVWQDVSADSTGLRQMQDSFPLSGELAEFDWGVGDGIRLRLPQVGVVDVTPRQIVALKRMLYPDGMGANTASFRGRPRDFVQTMRKFIRQVYADRRAFQGQLSYVSSNTASETR